ncbi:MAG: ATP-binding protein [Thermodesulfobacteriota bacterium]|nr:ATP-binding protein [Thermodesulfobacteriota bacterium]
MIAKSLLALIRPKFLLVRRTDGSDQFLFNYRKVWLISFILLTVVCTVPVTFFLIVNSRLSHEAIQNENHLRTLRLTSNSRRTITYFLEERMDALKYIIQEEDFFNLSSDTGLSYILGNLKMGFGGFVDLGLIDNTGIQTSYTGPFNLQGKNYSRHEWFINCVERGSYISEVFLGYRQIPHLIIAAKSPVINGEFYILRATLDIKKFISIITSTEMVRKSDAFICNREGLLQTPSRYYGEILDKIDLPIPPFSSSSQVFQARDPDGDPVLIGYAYIENSPYIFMVVKKNREIMKGWYSLQKEMIWFFSISIVIVLFVILCISTFMVNKIYDADQSRLKAMERLEGSSRLISIGRLAAGVAHEINNPLSVINENAGLIKDMFMLKKEYQEDERLLELIDDVTESVTRCGEITKQLLGFARQFRPSIQAVNLKNTINATLSFFRKEAQYRNISITVDIPEDLPIIHSDYGSLQQVFFNLINNAFQAVSKDGAIEITASARKQKTVAVNISDTGCGISAEDQKKIFEPFFTTKSTEGGTGLGLSIIYGILQKLNGDISVRSKRGKGTTFTVILPIQFEGDIDGENTTCG